MKTNMEHTNFLEKLSSQFAQSASVKNVFGDPINAGDKIIIPVAKIAYGLGGGYGQQGKKDNATHTDSPLENLPNRTENGGEGVGGGGGMYARPAGVYEITPSRTRFIPANNVTPLLIGIGVGFLLKGLIAKGRKK
jgi:uncharacterized spore protein YtfJ